MRMNLEWWHPERPLRWSTRPSVELPAGPEGTLPNWPSLTAFQPFLGDDGWVLRFREGEDGVTAMLCADSPPGTGAWEDAALPPSRAPWSRPAWRQELQGWVERMVGPHRLHQHRLWGRSTVWRVELGSSAPPAGRRAPRSAETLWFKQSYGMPPGEGAALRLAAQHRGAMVVPDPVAADGPRALMRPLEGQPLRERPAPDWAVALEALLAFQREADPDVWARAGVRDLRSGSWHARIAELFSSHGFDPAHADTFAPRFEGLPTAVLPQDGGPFNLRWLGDGRIQAFDWTDVVISTPGVLLKRFLNECRDDADRQAVTGAFANDPLWRATQPCAQLHETWRYHQELTWLDEDDPLAVWLRAGNARQLGRLLDRRVEVEPRSTPSG